MVVGAQHPIFERNVCIFKLVQGILVTGVSGRHKAAFNADKVSTVVTLGGSPGEA